MAGSACAERRGLHGNSYAVQAEQRAQFGLGFMQVRMQHPCATWRQCCVSFRAAWRKPNSWCTLLSGVQNNAAVLRALRKSRLISHRDNVNPFGASFLNYVTALKLTEVTIDATTFVEMEGSFETDLLVSNLRLVLVAQSACASEAACESPVLYVRLSR